VTLSMTKPNVDFEQYMQLKNKFSSAIIQPKGDLDTINILENPSQYNLGIKDAFSLLKKDGKKIGLSVIFKFENTENLLKQIQEIIQERI
ncbi:MAG: hypothetical protein ACRENO_02120, partial [Thermodesulfobacteriota bacterium]